MTRKTLQHLLLVASACLGLSAESRAAERPNVVFILADDLGINDLSCYGRKDQPTPHLDRLAREGVRLTDSYCAQPICSPSRAAILTGKTPARLHLTTFLPGRGDAPSQRLLHPKIEPRLPSTEKTIAERFKAAGYATACIGKWHLGEGEGYAPKFRGFDIVHAGRANTVPSVEEGGKGEYDLTRRAVEFVEANQSRPFFLYLPHNTPHIPIAAKKDLVEKHRAAFNPTYAAVIESMDDTVGLLLEKLDELNLSKSTIFIFTSDNGGLHVPEMDLTPATHNTPFRAGKGFVYEGGLRVPLIVRMPGTLPAGQVIDTPFINTQWPNTLLDLCGLPTDPGLDGASGAAILKGERAEPRPLFWHFPHYTNQGGKPAGAARIGDWKLVEDYDANRLELYDLKSDPSERRDLASDRPELARDMAAKLEAWRVGVGARRNTPNPAFQTELHRRLYVDVDISKLEPARTAADMRPALEPWRTLMAEVVRPPVGDSPKTKKRQIKAQEGNPSRP